MLFLNVDDGGEEFLNSFRFSGDNGEEEDEKIDCRRCRKNVNMFFGLLWALTEIKKHRI